MACRASDAAHAGCPARMADGRLFTDYRSRCDVQDSMELGELRLGSHEFRQHAIRNSESILARQRGIAFARAYCAPCVQPYNSGTMLPERDAVVCNSSTCARVPVSDSGWGTGRLYGTTEEELNARRAFLTLQEQLQRRDASACPDA